MTAGIVHRALIFAAAVLAGCPSTSSTVPEVPMSIRWAPVPVPTDDGTMLVYELLVGNYVALGLRPVRIDVRADDPDGMVLRSYAGVDLTRCLKPPAEGWPDVATVLLGLNVPPGTPVPASLHHSVTFEDGRTARGGTTPVAPPPVAIAPPLRGTRWVALNGPTVEPLYHRDATFPVGPRVYYPARFGIDWIRLGPDGRPFGGEGIHNADWYGHGADLLAVADGTIVDVREGVPENATVGTREIPMTASNIAGNYVLLDVGDRHDAFALYGHAIPGSITVRIGDRVRAGQVLGRLGNAGNSDAPHLHFQVCDGAGPLGTRNETLFCNGLPFVFSTYTLLGTTPPDFSDHWPTWAPSGPPVDRTDVMPLRDQVVDLP